MPMDTIISKCLIISWCIVDGGTSGSDDEAPRKSTSEKGREKSAKKASEATPDNHDNPLAMLQEKLKELNKAYELVVKNSHQLTKSASELDSGGNKPVGKLVEDFTLLKITSAAIVKVSQCTHSLLRN